MPTQKYIAGKWVEGELVMAPRGSAMRCYICQSPGDNIASDCREAFLGDDGHKVVYVGPTCFKNLERAGANGILCGDIGPQVFFTFEQAEAYAELKRSAERK